MKRIYPVGAHGHAPLQEILCQLGNLFPGNLLSPIQATTEAMRELFSSVIASGIVLMAVFIPVGFLPGTAGQLYKQFALTITFSIAISTFNALTLTPALSALLLRKQEKPRGLLGWLARRINGFLNGLRRTYQRSLQVLTHFKHVVMVLFIASLVLTVGLYLRVPKAFLPQEDQGYFINLIQASDGASLNYTRQIVEQAEQILLQEPEIQGTFAMGGVGFSGNTPN